MRTAKSASYVASMHLLMSNAKRVANKTTKAIGCRLGPSIGQLFVCEYPKSGGTWLGKMIADALTIPYPKPAVLPVTFPAVIHNHWRVDAKLDGVFYLYRDGRDVMVSYYFHRMRRLEHGEPNTVRRFARRYQRLFGPGYDPGDVGRHLPRFIEEEFRRPRGARITWREHVLSWHRRRGERGITYLSYESLLEDRRSALARAIHDVTGRELDPWTIETTVEKFSMQRMTGRRPGREDRTSFIRKGVAGDWRHHFTRETAQIFDDLAGDALIELGYEPDRAWVGRQPETTELPGGVVVGSTA